jgi:hypothetical protein
MKRLRSIFVVIFAIVCCVSLTQCRDRGAADPTSVTAGLSETTETTQIPAQTQPLATQTDPFPTQTEPTPTQTEPLPTETEPPMLYEHPLTGEPMADLSEKRPYAVVFNNVKQAQPQYGVGQADILCEILVEGAYTRCLGIFSDISTVDTFGSIRSARPYLVHLAQGFDAIFVHAGRSEEAKNYLNSTGWDHLDGVHGPYADDYFYRNQDRINAGYSYEHTLFIRAEQVRAYAQKLGCTFTRDGGVSYGWNFGDSSAATGQNMAGVTAWFNNGSPASAQWHKSTTLRFNATDGLYYASQYGSAYIDAATNEQLSFRNVLVLRTRVVNQGDAAGHLTITLTGSGTGYYLCDGKMIPIQWSRQSANSPFVFTTENGEPITMGVGKTYMGFVARNSLVQFE